MAGADDLEGLLAPVDARDLHLVLYRANRAEPPGPKAGFAVIDGVMCVSTPQGLNAIFSNPDVLKTYLLPPAERPAPAQPRSPATQPGQVGARGG